MDQKDQPKQPNWLVVAVVTTIVGGVVQVVVNHFDNIVAFLGGAFSHVHLSIGIVSFINTVSALATLGGAIASLLAYRYAKRLKQANSRFEQIREIASEIRRLATEPIEPVAAIEALEEPKVAMAKFEVFKQLEEPKS